MAFEKGSGSRFCGFVKRVYVNDAKTFAAVTLDIPSGRGMDDSIDIRCFKDGPIDEIAALKPGMVAEVTAKVSNESLTTKAKMKVVVDGHHVTVIKLTAKTVKVEPSSQLPTKNLDDDKMPGGW